MPINECCTNESDKMEISREKNDKGILVKKVCKSCNRNDNELIVEQISLGVDLRV